MSISTIQNFFKETITRAVTLVGATNIYVSALPTPDEGYVVISPSSSSLREIVYYTAKGTDSNGTYLTVTLANRGLGGTTAQTHTIGEPVRMNITAEHIKEISDALDQIVAGGAQDASTTSKGISKLSVAPVSATNPVAVGDNDPRVPTADPTTLFADKSTVITLSSKNTLSDNLLFSNDVGRRVESDSYTKIKETRLDVAVVNLRMKVTMTAVLSSYVLYFYLNGVALSGELSGSAGSTQVTTTFTYDCSDVVIKKNDLLQVYARRVGGSGNIGASNFRLYGTLDKKFISSFSGKAVVSPVITINEDATEVLSATSIL